MSVFSRVTDIGARAGGTTGRPLPKMKKMSVFGQKIVAMWAKNKSHEFYSYIAILLDDYTYYSRDEYHGRLQFNVTSRSLFLLKKTVGHIKVFQMDVAQN